MKNLTIYDQLATQNPMQAVEMMGAAMARSGMFGITNAGQGTVLALHAFMTGKSVIELAAKYNIIEGRLAMRADAMQAGFQATGGRIKWVETTTEKCVAVFSHPDFAPDGVTVEITLKELKETGVAIGKTGKIKDNYRRSPRQMLRARAISEGVRMVNPDVIVGMYTPEEISDFEPQKPAYIPPPPPSEPLLPAKNLDYTDHINPEDEPAALAFLRKIGWLGADQELVDLRQSHLQSIDSKPDSFLAEARKYYEDLNNEQS